MSEIKVRYELEVGGAKGFLAPLSFPVANAALGNKLLPLPKILTAGAILINSLWIRGSKKLKEKGELFDGACLQAAGILSTIDTGWDMEENVISIPLEGKIYKCVIKEKIQRETLEMCIGLSMPTVGLPRPLTAGKMILEENWVSGDEEIKKNEELLIMASAACYNLIKFEGSSLKKV